jgi:FKBP-type peptidyl-prolyl cis-trans isomerase
MTVGESAAFSVASQYAYGSAGVPPVIPPGASLDFQVTKEEIHI